MVDRIAKDSYDRKIVPSETAARIEREGQSYKQTPEASEAEVKSDLDTTAGATVDQEGLMNNFAIEPEMYYEEPGDLQDKHEQEEARRKQELKEVNESGGKGVGII
jgi:hypothetical protein